MSVETEQVMAHVRRSRPALTEYLTAMAACSSQFGEEWAIEEGGAENAAYRRGMAYAYRDVERFLERDEVQK